MLIFGLFSATLIKTSENQSRMCSTDCMIRLWQINSADCDYWWVIDVMSLSHCVCTTPLRRPCVTYGNTWRVICLLENIMNLVLQNCNIFILREWKSSLIDEWVLLLCRQSNIPGIIGIDYATARSATQDCMPYGSNGKVTVVFCGNITQIATSNPKCD